MTGLESYFDLRPAFDGLFKGTGHGSSLNLTLAGVLVGAGNARGQGERFERSNLCSKLIRPVGKYSQQRQR